MTGMNSGMEGKDSGAGHFSVQVKEGSESAQSNTNKRWQIIILITSAVMVALCLATVVGIVYMTQKNSQTSAETVLRFLAEGKQEKEKVRVDDSQSMISLELTEQRSSVILDYGKRIMFGKLYADGKPRCFAKAFDGNQPELEDFKQHLQSGNTTATTYEMTLSSHLISDRSFLPGAAQSLCKDTPISWAINTDVSESPIYPLRVKRGKITVEGTVFGVKVKVTIEW